MAVLLVGMSVMAIMLTVVMPVWKQTTQREKEAELVFRGEQYTRAIGLFQRKNGPGTLPPNLEVLLDQRFLRRKYKDPITGDDFLLLTAGGNVAATPGGGITAGGVGTQTPGATQTPATGTMGAPLGGASTTGQTPSTGQPPGPGVGGGIIGVQSKSKAQSIRIYNGRTHYNEWLFVFQQQTQAPGAGAPGTATPGQRGRSGQPGQQGQPGQPLPGGPGRQQNAPRGGFGPFPTAPEPRRPGR